MTDRQRERERVRGGEGEGEEAGAADFLFHRFGVNSRTGFFGGRNSLSAFATFHIPLIRNDNRKLVLFLFVLLLFQVQGALRARTYASSARAYGARRGTAGGGW
jgi:hypothetical protein